MSSLSLSIMSQWGLLHKLEKQKVAQLLSAPYKMVGSVHDYLLTLIKPGKTGNKTCIIYVKSTSCYLKFISNNFYVSFLTKNDFLFMATCLDGHVFNQIFTSVAITFAFQNHLRILLLLDNSRNLRWWLFRNRDVVTILYDVMILCCSPQRKHLHLFIA